MGGFGRGAVAQRRVQASPVMEDLHVVDDGEAGVASSRTRLPVLHLVCQLREDRFRGGLSGIHRFARRWLGFDVLAQPVQVRGSLLAAAV
jgi:hypothetical protein